MTTAKPTTLRDLQRMSRQGEKFACLTCYDATTARWLAGAGVHVLLVGDTAAEMILGHSSTVHAPQPPSPQASLVPVRPRSSGGLGFGSLSHPHLSPRLRRRRCPHPTFATHRASTAATWHRRGLGAARAQRR
jgi:hypothetical protein